MDELLQALAQGLLIGSTYGLLALGMGLIYSVSGIVNFSHGDFVSLGMYLCFALFSALSHRMADVMALVDEVAFRGVAQRLAARLLQHSYPIEVTHQALADELATRREVVSRILGTFQRSGMIRLGRKRIDILDASALGGLLGVQG